MPADTSLLFQSTKIKERQVIIMCRNIGNIYVGLPIHPAVMFMNSNKSERNIHKIMRENRRRCSMAGITLMQECIVNKGPNRDIDREAVNMLVSILITGQYDTVVVENLQDIAEDESDCKEFMRDAANIGVGFFELSTMQYYEYEKQTPFFENTASVWDGGIGC